MDNSNGCSLTVNSRLATVPALVLTLIASGCAGERDVIIKIPISRLELPEPGPRRMDVGFGPIGEAKAFLTRDQANVAPDVQQPEFSEDDDGMLRFDALVHPAVQVSLKTLSGYVGVQGKYMPIRDAGPFSFAVTLGFAGSEDAFDFNDGATIARTTVNSDLRDLAAIFGWRLDRTVIVYGGPWYSAVDYHGHHFSDRGGNPDVEFDYRGEVEAVGANVGVGVTPGRWGRLMLEYSQARLRGGSARERVGYPALAFEISFGPLRPAP